MSTNDEPGVSNPETPIAPQSELGTQPENPSNTDKSNANQNSDNSKLANDLKALQGIQASKDKALKELQDKLEETQRNQKRIEDQAIVKDLLLETELPQGVREILKKDLGNLTPDNFKDYADKLMNVYNAGIEESKRKTTDFVNKEPDPVKTADFDERIKNAKSREDLDLILKGRI